MDTPQAYVIPKPAVAEAWRVAKARHGAAGIDDESVAPCEADRKNNLYVVWNRMSSRRSRSRIRQAGPASSGSPPRWIASRQRS